MGTTTNEIPNYCPPPRTCFKRVTHLEPGSYLEIKPDGTYTKHKSWSWPFANDSLPLSHDAFAELLDDAIRLQMRFDMEGCLFLSGGVDSSVVAAHLRHQSNRPRMLAFGLDCREREYGEFHLAQQVASQFDMIDLQPIQHGHGIVPANIEKVLYHADQPHGDFSFFPIRTLCEAAHKSGAIVAFKGDGPDEVLSGFSDNEAFFRMHSSSLPLSDYFAMICFMLEPARSRVLNPDFAASMIKPGDLVEDILAPWRHLHPIDQIAAYECTSLSPGNNLIKTDRMGAGLLIEGRSPFAGYCISEAFVRLPVTDKIRVGVSKHYLEDFGLRDFERDFMFRKKSMPNMLIGKWIKGPLETWACHTLRMLDPFRYDVVRTLALFEGYKAGKANHTKELRILLMSSTWMRQLGKA